MTKKQYSIDDVIAKTNDLFGEKIVTGLIY